MDGCLGYCSFGSPSSSGGWIENWPGWVSPGVHEIPSISTLGSISSPVHRGTRRKPFLGEVCSFSAAPEVRGEPRGALLGSHLSAAQKLVEANRGPGRHDNTAWAMK
jgi:hypothetical protein